MGTALQIRGLCKSYNVPVLQDFDLELAPGEVHALVGSNGAGKSTIARILTGLTPRDAGEILLQGVPFEPRSKVDAMAAGVGLVLQELNLVPTLSVAENLFLHALPQRFGLVDHRELRERGAAALERVGLGELDPETPAGELGIGRQQLVEIAGTLAQKSSVLILDEPTAALTGPEIEILFENVDRLRAEGVAVIYVSHRMDEISRIADRVSVLRDGRRIATHPVGEVETRQLVREMAGDEIAQRVAHRVEGGERTPGLIVSDLKAGNPVRGVTFEANRGEILGVAGLVGSGRTELLRAIFGADPVDSGEVRLGVDGASGRFRSPAEAVGAGVGFVPEDRKEDGLLLSKSILLNTSLATVPEFSRGGVIRGTEEERATSAVNDRLRVKRDSIHQPVGELSGGNQQKIVISRWLLTDSDILLLDEPTRGVDVAAKEAIYGLLDELAAAGKTLVMVSSDLEELMRVSHRLVVMSNGKITGEFEPGTWSQEAITAAAFEGYRTGEGEVAA